VQIYDKLGELFHIDDVFGIIAARVDNFGASGDLERLFGLKDK
jgi:hypothetical protein